MKHILLSAFIFLLLIGCKKDNKEIVAPIIQPTCKLTSISANGKSYLYQYNAKEKLSNFIDPFNPPIKFFYDSNNRLTKINYYRRDDESAVVATEQIEYNAKGQWAKITYAEPGNVNKSERTYEYDANGLRTKIFHHREGKLEQSYGYEYSNGNLVKLSLTEYRSNPSNPSIFSYLFEYDTSKENKLAKFEETVHVGYSSFGYGNYATPSKNMIKKINSQEQGGPVTFYTNYEYEYNDKGYPTKLTISGGDYDVNGIPDLFVYNYTYQCK